MASPATIYLLDIQRRVMRQGDFVYYLYGDHLGFISLITDVEGNPLHTARYTPYGEPR